MFFENQWLRVDCLAGVFTTHVRLQVLFNDSFNSWPPSCNDVIKETHAFVSETFLFFSLFKKELLSIFVLLIKGEKMPLIEKDRYKKGNTRQRERERERERKEFVCKRGKESICKS